MDLNIYKTPVYSNINDVPRIPTAQLGGNGSDFVQRINGLIDALPSAIAEVVAAAIAANPPSSSNSIGNRPQTIRDNIYLYVDSVNGSDTNDGATAQASLKSIQKALDIISKYQIRFEFIIFLSGSFSEALDFSNIWCNSNYALPLQLVLRPLNLSVRYSLTLGADTRLIAPRLSNVDVCFRNADITFNSAVDLVNFPGITFDNCNFIRPSNFSPQGDSAIFYLSRSQTTFATCVYDIGTSNKRLFEAYESYVIMGNGSYAASNSIGRCYENTRFRLSANVPIVGTPATSLSLSRGSVASVGSYSFSAGTIATDATSFVTTQSAPYRNAQV